MVPDIARTGRSFNGALAYYLHDKREGERPQSAERVAWVEMRNLATDDPQAAKRVMITTAMHADELKAAAGIKNTGRKSNAHVYAYSLAWHPDEAGKLDRAEMLRAADGSLKALGADHLQSMIICHTDQKHPHIHVVLNRVDPATGKMFSTSNDRLKLSDWANQYERERGAILTPKREEKRQAREEFKDKAARKDYAAEQKKAAEARTTAKKDGRDPNPAATLKAFGEAQKARHKEDWRALSEKNKAAREAIYSASGAAIKELAEKHKAKNRPTWAAHFKDERERQAAFDARERYLRGIVSNALDAARQQRERGQLPKDKGALRAIFENVLDSQKRRQTFTDSQSERRAAVAQSIKKALDADIAQVKQYRAAMLEKQRQAFDKARADLIERQSAEREKIRAAWRTIYQEKEQRRQDRERINRQAAKSASRAERYERNKSTKPADMRKQEARAKAFDRQAQEKPAPHQQEKPAMKNVFDRSIGKAPPKAAPIETKVQPVSQAQPAPSPSGDVPRPTPKKMQEVPKAAPAKPSPAEAKRDTWHRAAGAKAQPPAAPKKDWSKTASPAPAKAAEPKKDWSKAASEKPREVKKLPPRAMDRDRER